jgi:hypothetical protein
MNKRIRQKQAKSRAIVYLEDVQGKNPQLKAADVLHPSIVKLFAIALQILRPHLAHENTLVPSKNTSAAIPPHQTPPTA